MNKHTMKIATNDSDNTQSRIVIEVNGFEIDIIADEDGIAIDINNGHVVLTGCSFGWDDKHENEDQKG